jgi:hypothetical protein
MNPMTDIRAVWNRCDRCFHEQNVFLWPHLSRAIGLMVVLNTSLFFLTGAVTHGGYYYPVIALVLLAIAKFLILLPLGFQARLPFYMIVLGLWIAAGWLLGASIFHWLRQAA